jgi:eukaryotic-like serine/threonine-protein kinase
MGRPDMGMQTQDDRERPVWNKTSWPTMQGQARPAGNETDPRLTTSGEWFPRRSANACDRVPLPIVAELAYSMTPDVPGPNDWPSVPGFEILEELGRGGMGVVYKARQINLGRMVALKMVLAGAHAGEGALARFLNEAKAIASLQHPDIVQIHDVGQADGHPYFSFEFIDGGNLAQQIGGRPQDSTQAARIIRSLARAIHAAHLRGIIHRDLKPSNILLSADGRPKITDFGLAKRIEDDSHQTGTGNIIGTPAYMAPEQTLGTSHDAGPLADQHALGAILYELITGRPPFQGATTYDTIEQVRTQEPVPPTRLQPRASRDLETICLKCLQKEPQRRYQDAAALADDLDRFLDGRPILARPISAGERLGRWCRRNPRAAVLAAAVLVLLATVAVTSTVFAAHLARARRAAVAAFRGECQKSLELLSDKQRAELTAELAARGNRLAREQTDRALDALASVLSRVRDLEDAPGLYVAKRELSQAAASSLDNLAREDSTSSGFTESGVAGTFRRLRELNRTLGRFSEAKRIFERAEAILTSLPAGDSSAGLDLAALDATLGDLCLDDLADPQAARTYFAKALDLHRAAAVRRPGDGDLRRAVVRDLHRLVSVCSRVGDIDATRRFEREETRWHTENPTDELIR